MDVFLVCSILFLTLCHSLAQGIEYTFIYSAQELINLLNVTSEPSQSVQKVNIMLKNDLDFSGIDFYPLGRLNSICYPFSGVLDGDGHSINNINMHTYGKPGTYHAGLFCAMENATVKDLVFEKTCSFTGHMAGALSVKAMGTLSMDNVINRASVTGQIRVGGLIGMANTTTFLTMTNCVNEGHVSRTQTNGDHHGGLMGQITKAHNGTVTIKKCTNRGNVDADTSGGGVVGGIDISKNLTVLFEDCVNDGNVTGDYNIIGGIIGGLEDNFDTLITINNTVNNGAIEGNEGMGGLVGRRYNGRNATLTVTRSTNNGRVTSIRGGGGIIGSDSPCKGNTINLEGVTNRGDVQGRYNSYVAGLIGFLNLEGENTVAVSITDSANYGSVRVLSGYGCGFFYPNAVREDAALTVGNSINKGAVNGTYAYGIAPYVGTGSSVVSTGTVVGTTEAHSFWAPNPTASMFFAPSETCVNCTEVILFEKNATNGLYYTTDARARPDVMLNDMIKELGYSMFWTSTLDLTPERLEVQIGAPVGVAVFVARGTRLGTIEALAPYPAPRYVLADANSADSYYDRTTSVTRDMSIAIVRRTKVIVRIPPTDVRNVDAAKVARAIADLVPDSDRMLTTTLVIGENNQVAQIDLFVLSEDTANTIVDALRSLNRGKGCTADILCKHTMAFVEGNEPSSSPRLAAPLALFFTLAILFFAF